MRFFTQAWGDDGFEVVCFDEPTATDLAILLTLLEKKVSEFTPIKNIENYGTDEHNRVVVRVDFTESLEEDQVTPIEECFASIEMNEKTWNEFADRW